MDIAQEVNQTKESVKRAHADLLNTFKFVPDDKLDWSPAASARWALWMVGHCSSANEAFATAIRGDKLPLPEDPSLISDLIRNGGKETVSREEAVQGLEASTEAVLSALDKLTPESIEGIVDSPFGPMPIRFWMSLPAIHMTGHARQLDYLETVWGDLKDHMVLS